MVLVGPDPRVMAMRRPCPQHLTARPSLPLLALLAAALAAPTPAAAQAIPWIGLSARGARLLHEAGTGHHASGAADRFGRALAAGDFDGNGFDDLAVGAPDRDDAAAGADVGGAAVLYGNLLSDDFESGGRRLWSATAP